MQFFRQMNWTELILACFVLTATSVHAQTVESQTAASVDHRKYESFRRELSQLFHQVFDRTVQPVHLQESLSAWNENFLPAICSKQLKATSYVNRSSRGISDRRFISKDDVGVHEQNYEGQRRIPKEKKATHALVDKNANDFLDKKGDATLSRVKRFLVLSSPREVSDFLLWPYFVQMPGVKRQLRNFVWMKYFILLTNYLKRKLMAQSPASRPQLKSYSGDQLKLHTLASQNVYHRIRKREASEIKSAKRESEARPDTSNSANIRKKRFLFGEAADFQLMPSFSSIMMGTAVDPNTGKTIEFGGDVMRNMIINSYTSSLPLFAQPPPGREPGELTKIMAPLWYFSNLQRTHALPSSLNSKTYDQKRNAQGYYGETMQGKRRRRRLAES